MTFDISKMLSPDVYSHPVDNIKLIETHASWVVLTGEYAYKIKKPVNFGFLDFSTLQKRHKFCNQELVLNRRLTSNIYLDIVGISIHQQSLRINQGETIEYAIKMQQFDQSAQLDNMLVANQLNLTHMHAIAQLIAGFHQRTNVAAKNLDFGEPDIVNDPVIENFSQIKEHLDSSFYDKTLDSLQAWSESEYSTLKPVLIQRKQHGFIRDCHGDMHLRNLIWLGDKSRIESGKGPMAFDCIEFNDYFRWIDVINEVAFLMMDLQQKQQNQLANRFINSYLEQTGDYAGLAVLSYYLNYRAMVRAKVAVLQLNQAADKNVHNLLTEEFESYIALAKNYTLPKTGKLIIMRGVSASGKSTVSQQIVDDYGVIRIRSDVERKRSFEATEAINTPNKINNGLYDEKVSELTYEKLLQLASQIIIAGFSVIVDAAFLKQNQRKAFQDLADKLQCPYIIFELTAPDDVLRKRIRERKNDVSDADLQVLEYQLSHWQPLLKNEMKFSSTVNTDDEQDIQKLFGKLTS